MEQLWKQREQIYLNALEKQRQEDLKIKEEEKLKQQYIKEEIKRLIEEN